MILFFQSMASGGTSNEDESRPQRMKRNDENMKKSIKAISYKKITFTLLVEYSLFHFKTLDDWIKGHTVHGQIPSPKTALSAEKEKSLVNYLLYLADQGFPLTRTMVKAFAWEVAKKSGNEKRFNVE